MKGTLFFGPPFFFFFFFVLFSFWSAEARITTHSIGPTRSRRHIGGGRRWKNISPSLRLISFYVYHVDLFVLSQICPLRMYHTSKTRESGRKPLSFPQVIFTFLGLLPRLKVGQVPAVIFFRSIFSPFSVLSYISGNLALSFYFEAPLIPSCFLAF